MTPIVQIALITAIPPTLAALGAILTVVLSDQRARRERAAAGKKLDHITILTNSTLTAANKRIDELEALVQRLLHEREEQGD